MLREGVRPGVERAWRELYGNRWLQEVNGLLYQPDRNPDPNDPAFLLKGMLATWKGSFGKVLARSTYNYVSLLREARNNWAHHGKLSSDETVMILGHCIKVLREFKATEQAEKVQNLRRGLQRQIFAEETRTEQRRAATLSARGGPMAGLTPWREVVAPHRDVAEGRFLNAEFAADLWQVLTGRAEEEYQDPRAFFARTFITDGLADLICIAAQRLSGQGGEPVVELQTSFGGGKTHSLIALYHLASSIPAAKLPGAGELLASEGLSVPGRVSRAAFIGQAASASDPEVKDDGTVVHTLWGEIAWQLGGPEGYAIVANADRAATNPGAKLVKLFEKFGPALVLIDEWIAYARDLPIGTEEVMTPAGNFDTQFTFAQALTEAAAAVDDTLVLISIPSSDMEVGGEKGRDALEKLKNVVSRRSAPWRAASTDESFEIVRRRLFEPVPPGGARRRDAVVRAYHNLYRDDPDKFPAEVREVAYRRRMEASYPIHPELFDRLYQDWSTLERFQRTRGMLRMMAAVISALWEGGDSSLMIMPGTLPMGSGKVLPEVINYLEERWDPIIQTDVDGSDSLPLRIDNRNRSLGRYSATRRAARTTFLGTAPQAPDRRGVDARRIVLGCVQPGERPGAFNDALRKLARDATYLYNRDTRYWYDTKPTLTRLARDRAADFSEAEVDLEIRRRVTAGVPRQTPFGGVHVFPEGPGDVPDQDDSVRLVILPPTAACQTKDFEASAAAQEAEDILLQRQGGPRINQNLLVFMAADAVRVGELRDGTRHWLAWKSIYDDREAAGLNLTPASVEQVQERMRAADTAVEVRIKGTFIHLLTPVKQAGRPQVEWRRVPAGGDRDLTVRAADNLRSSEELITAYSGIRVRIDLDGKTDPDGHPVNLWEDGAHLGVRRLWNYYCQYLYMPRLANFGVLAAAVSSGVALTTWNPETFAFAQTYDPQQDRYLGLQTAQNISVGESHTALLVHPDRAHRQITEDAARRAAAEASYRDGETTRTRTTGRDQDDRQPSPDDPLDDNGPPPPTRFYARKELDLLRALRDIGDILAEITPHLDSPEARVTLTLEINADSPGYSPTTIRTITENAPHLGFDDFSFEE